MTAEDVVAALEANRQRSAGTVLRITPPFSGRMRARVHRADDGADYDDAAPRHLPPEWFVDAAPSLPAPVETEDAVRSDASVSYDAETHRRRHEAALEAWRATDRESFVETTTIDTPGGPHEVEVAILGV